MSNSLEANSLESVNLALRASRNDKGAEECSSISNAFSKIVFPLLWGPRNTVMPFGRSLSLFFRNLLLSAIEHGD